MRHALLALPLLGLIACADEMPSSVYDDSELEFVPFLADASDLDQDGLPESFEDELAQEYLPFLSRHQDEACPESGIVYRLRPHPDDSSMIHIIYDVLYDDDCGADSHPGDNEVFAIAVNPNLPAPQGILAMVGIAHQDTLCNNESRCETCGPDGNTCSTYPYQGATWPVVFESRNKHGNYLFDGIGRHKCDFACWFADRCEQALTGARPPMLNAGEPDYPLTNDLTTSGLVTSANGFMNASLMHYDPWGGESFGEAGVVSKDLVDPDFDVPIPACN